MVPVAIVNLLPSIIGMNVCLVVFSSGPGLHLRARLPVARLCVCKRGVFGCLLHTNQASRR